MSRTWACLSSLWAFGCLGGSDFRGDTDGDADSDADTDADTDPGACGSIPDGPFSGTQLSAIASEDVAFDAEGNVVGSDGQALLKSPYSGAARLFTKAIAQQAGLRFLPDGRLVVADDSENNLFLVEEDGTSHILLSGLSYPNGITIDLEGFIYLTEKSAGRVQRIDPETGEATTIVSGGIAEPNGVTFDPTYRWLYIAGTSGAGIVYRVSIDADGTPGPLEEWARGVGAGRLDGLACDACGNVYVCDYASADSGGTVVHRISPDGEDVRVVLDTGGGGGGGYWGSFLANMDWGSGVGGWSETSLYFADTASQRVLEVEVGVRSKPRPYP